MGRCKSRRGVCYVRTLQVPRSLAGVKYKLQKLIAYLTVNPAAESIERNVTAARAQTLLDDIIAKENAVNIQNGVLRQATSAKKGAFNAVRRQITSLTRELTDLMEPLDTRWLAFGLKMPGAFEIPVVPQNVTAI